MNIIILETCVFLSYLDIICKIATVLIALFNIYFAIKLFRLKDKKENVEKERDRKLLLLKTLVLDHNLKCFYDLFDNLDIILLKLKEPSNKEQQIIDINSAITEIFISLRKKFYDLTLAIDDKLYEEIKLRIDSLQDDLIIAIYDKGINLSHEPKYEELISDKISVAKTDTIKILFTYRG